MIGLFDSGSGGLTVLQACAAALPDRHFVYLGDHARAPYGMRDAEEITDFTRQGVEFLFNQGCQLVLIACNSAAAVCLRRLQQNWLAQEFADRRILGVHIPLIEALTGRLWTQQDDVQPQNQRKIAVFATPATIASHAFDQEIASRSDGLVVLSQPCPGLADAIEAGASSAHIRSLIDGFWRQLQQQLGAEIVDSAVLACTHYPLVQADFSAVLPPHVQILTQPAIVAGSLTGYLARRPHLDQRGEARVDLLTSGDPKRIATTRWIPPTFRHFRHVDLA